MEDIYEKGFLLALMYLKVSFRHNSTTNCILAFYCLWVVWKDKYNHSFLKVESLTKGLNEQDANKTNT